MLNNIFHSLLSKNTDRIGLFETLKLPVVLGYNMAHAMNNPNARELPMLTTLAQRFETELRNTGAPVDTYDDLIGQSQRGYIQFADGSVVAWNGEATTNLDLVE